MSFIIDGTNGLTFNDSSTQKSAARVLQVVHATYSTETQNNTTTYADTGLTATITPTSASNKILVIINQGGIAKLSGDANSYCRVKLFRGATDLGTVLSGGGYTNSSLYNQVSSLAFQYYDTPATTSATTYKTQFSNNANTTGVRVQESNSLSTITLMEIAA